MRLIDKRFIHDLLEGELTTFLGEVKNNKTLSLEIRDGYINIYHRGGNLLRITQKKEGYEFFFDAKYCIQENDKALIESLSKRDSISYIKHFYGLIELWINGLKLIQNLSVNINIPFLSTIQRLWMLNIKSRIFPGWIC